MKMQIRKEINERKKGSKNKKKKDKSKNRKTGRKQENLFIEKLLFNKLR